MLIIFERCFIITLNKKMDIDTYKNIRGDSMKILLKNGLICDGTGMSARCGSVLIEDGVIEEIYYIGEEDEQQLKSLQMDEMVDCAGKVISPGFVDIHRHCDKCPMEKGEAKRVYADTLLRQGITTTITGNCGISIYPQPKDQKVLRDMRNYYEPVLGNTDVFDGLWSYSDYLNKTKKFQLPVNTGMLIGMGAVRISVKGFERGRFTLEEKERCKQIIREAMEEGARGVSIGLMYLPECFEYVDELGEILHVVGQYDGVVTAHIRGEGDSLLNSIREAIEIAKTADCRLEISHLKACGISNWNHAIFEAIRLIEEAQIEGVRVTCDVYPYNCGSTTLMSLLPPDFSSGDPAKSIRLLERQEERDRLRRLLTLTYPDWDNYVISLGWDKFIISSVHMEENRQYIGKSISDIKAFFADKDEVDILSELLVSENGNVAIIIQSMDENDVEEVIKLPYSAVISDAIYADTPTPHPRMYGAFPRMISYYVNQRKTLGLEEAISKMTKIPAERMNIPDRGVIKKGYRADVLVFDPAMFTDHATYIDPAQYATGLYRCYVNGVETVREDVVLNRSAGEVL